MEQGKMTKQVEDLRSRLNANEVELEVKLQQKQMAIELVESQVLSYILFI